MGLSNAGIKNYDERYNALYDFKIHIVDEEENEYLKPGLPGGEYEQWNFFIRNFLVVLRVSLGDFDLDPMGYLTPQEN